MRNNYKILPSKQEGVWNIFINGVLEGQTFRVRRKWAVVRGVMPKGIRKGLEFNSKESAANYLFLKVCY